MNSIYRAGQNVLQEKQQRHNYVVDKQLQGDTETQRHAISIINQQIKINICTLLNHLLQSAKSISI